MGGHHGKYDHISCNAAFMSNNSGFGELQEIEKESEIYKDEDSQSSNGFDDDDDFDDDDFDDDDFDDD